jgi:hypothetical protein
VTDFTVSPFFPEKLKYYCWSMIGRFWIGGDNE